MNRGVVSICLALLVFSAIAQAQLQEFTEGCTTIQCRRDAFLMREREELNEMQLDLMEMLFEIQALNEQEAYIMGYHGAQAMQNPHMQRNHLL